MQDQELRVLDRIEQKLDFLAERVSHLEKGYERLDSRLEKLVDKSDTRHDAVMASLTALDRRVASLEGKYHGIMLVVGLVSALNLWAIIWPLIKSVAH